MSRRRGGGGRMSDYGRWRPEEAEVEAAEGGREDGGGRGGGGGEGRRGKSPP